jgi:hypothetical protein
MNGTEGVVKTPEGSKMIFFMNITRFLFHRSCTCLYNFFKSIVDRERGKRGKKGPLRT